MKYFFLVFVALAFACKSSRQAQSSQMQFFDFDTVEVSPKSTSESQNAIYRASNPRKFDIIHTDIAITPDWKLSRLQGKAVITGKPYFYSIDSVEFDARGMIIHQMIQIHHGKSRILKDFHYNGLKIGIKLDKPYTAKDTLIFQIEYTARPHELDSLHLKVSEDHGCYFIKPDSLSPYKPYQIWTQGETQDNSVWFPTIDSPNERMTNSLAIRVENKFVTLSNGDKVKSENHPDGTRTDYWEMNQPHAPYLVMFAVGEYAVVKDGWRGKEVSYYVEKAYEPYARDIFGETPAMLEFFSNLLKYPYPWSKYSQVVVRDYISGAMENTGAVVFGEFAQKTKSELASDNDELTIAHELFHHWFGDLVTCESWSNLPLNESFANYSEYLWLEHKYGRHKADAHNLDERNQYFNEFPFKNVDLIRFQYDSREDMFDSHSYAKGGRVLHMLRKLVGDEAFFAALHFYLTQNQYKTVEIHQLRLAFEEVTGLDLNWFFNQWFLNKGFPKLEIQTQYQSDKKQILIDIQQIQHESEAPLYRLPVFVDVYAGGKVQRHAIVITQKTQQFFLPCASKPDLVNFDAEKSLLCQKKENKSPEEMEFQFYKTPLYADMQEALMYFADNPKEPKRRKVMLDALSNPWEDLRELSITLLSNEDEFSWLKDHASKFKIMAQSDPDANVRESALVLYAELAAGSTELSALAEKLLDDKAANVFCAALEILSELNPKLAFEKLPLLMKDGNSLIVDVAASIYASNPQPENAEFYYKNFEKTGWGQSKFDFIMNMSKFVLGLDSKSEILKSSNFFERIVRSNEMWFVRLAGYFGLASNRDYWNRQYKKYEQDLKNSNLANRAETEALKLEAWNQSMLHDTKIEQFKKTEKSPEILEYINGKK